MRNHFETTASILRASCLFGLFLLGCGAADAGTADEAETGSEEQALSSGTVQACTDPNLRGTCPIIPTGLWPTLASTGLPNDSLSSFSLGSNTRVTFCADPNFAGRCGTYTQGLTQITNPPNDTVSSIRIVSNSTPDCRNGNTFDPPQGYVFLYRGVNLLDDCVTLSSGNYSTAATTGLQNDTLSSMKIGPHTTVTVWTNPNFSGTRSNYIPTFEGTSTTVMQVDHNDTMSSIQVQ
jgi:hypothetical protein